MTAKLWWMIRKDLRSECRARQVWPAMILLGIVVAAMFSIQMDLLPAEKQRLVGGLLWLAIFFAGMLAVERSFASEREEGCWEGLFTYPVSPSTVYLAKLSVNVIALGVVQCILIPLFAVLADAPLLSHPAAMLLVAGLGNLGISAVGTLSSALASSLPRRGNLLVLLVLPAAIPVLLGSPEATRLLVEGDLSAEWLRWVQLLGAFAVVFITAGIILFDFVVED